jgi:hypothetical protein
MTLARTEPSPSPPGSPSPNVPSNTTQLQLLEQQAIPEITMAEAGVPSPFNQPNYTSAEPLVESTPRSHPVNSLYTDENSTGTQVTPASTPSALRSRVLAATARGDPDSATRGAARSPLDKFTNAIMPEIQDAYPTAVFNGIDLDCLDKWVQYKGFKLLAIPFENDARALEKHDNIRAKIFAAAAEITQSREVGVAAPLPSQEANNTKAVPTAFLIYNLTSENHDLLLARKVWSSIAVTFRVTPLDLPCPNFMFTIKGFTEFANENVQEMVQKVWLDNDLTRGTADIITEIPIDERTTTLVAVHSFLRSVWIERLNTKDSGDSANPRYNVYANGALISKDDLWMKLRRYLANRSYFLYLQGKGTTEISPYTCGICHGVDHPRGLCPFPKIEGWNGPLWRLSQETRRIIWGQGSRAPRA